MVDAEFLEPLSPWERGEKTRAEMAAERGVSLQWLRKLMARERAGEMGYAATDPGNPDPLDYPQMALTTDPEVESGHWVHLHTGSCSADRGRFNVGGRVNDVVGGPRVEQDKPKKSKHKFKPKLKAKKCAS